MKTLVFIFTILFLNSYAFCQNTTFIKRLFFYNLKSEVSRGQHLFNNDIYLNATSKCNEDFCTAVVKFDNLGYISWKKAIKSRTANRNTVSSVENQRIYLASIQREIGNELNEISILNKNTGDSLGYFAAKIPQEFDAGSIDGLLLSKNNLYLYGWSFIESDTSIGYIQVFNNLGILDKTFIFKNPKNEQSSIFDLTFGSDSLLYFISFDRQKGSGFNDSRKITTINQQGEIVKNVNYGHNNLGIYLPIGFTLTLEDDFIFTAWQPDSVFGGSSTPQLVRTKNNGDVLWTYNWTSTFFGEKVQYTISDVQMAKNGDILGCGYIYRGWYDGYIFRMSGDGEMIWERRYNIQDSLDDKLDAIYLNNVGEDSDGYIIASGSHTNSFNFNDEVFLVKTDADGCIEDYGCEYRTILKEGTVDVIDLDEDEKEISVYPNPINASFTIDVKSTNVVNYKVYDILGKVVYFNNNRVLDHTKVDCSSWGKGFYFLVIKTENGNDRVIKLMK